MRSLSQPFSCRVYWQSGLDLTVATGSLSLLVEAKLTILLFITCLLKRRSLRIRNASVHYHSFRQPIPSSLPRTSCFQAEDLDGCPAQDSSQSPNGSSNFPHVWKCCRHWVSLAFHTQECARCICHTHTLTGVNEDLKWERKHLGGQSNTLSPSGSIFTANSETDHRNHSGT